MKETVLVTGAAGFIGAHLVHELLRETHLRVVALDDLSGGFRDNLPTHERFDFVEGSIVDTELVDRLFQDHEFKYVYHLAAYAAEGLSHFIRRFNYTNNLIGSVNLINASLNHDVECFVFASSIAVYGTGQVPMREEAEPRPEDPYGIAKYAIELDLRAAEETHGLNYVVFRPHNVYGEFQNLCDRYRNVVGIFMNQILHDEPLTVFGDGTQRRAFSYVGDIIAPIAKAPWTPVAHNQIFNVGADRAYTVNELCSAVASAMGKVKYPVRYLGPREEVHTAYSDHTRVKSVFGSEPQTSLESGLKKMATWVQKVGARSSLRFDNIEVAANLPSSWRTNRRGNPTG